MGVVHSGEDRVQFSCAILTGDVMWKGSVAKSA